MPNRITQTYSFKKLKRKHPGILRDAINVMGSFINKAIQDGVENGTDIHGNAFEKLKPNTIMMGGSKPLLRSGKMKETLLKKATNKDLKFIIQMDGKSDRTGKIYGQYHNEGYVNSPKAMFPGAKVEKREWFGIPKTMKEGGKELDKALLDMRMAIRMAWKK